MQKNRWNTKKQIYGKMQKSGEIGKKFFRNFQPLVLIRLLPIQYINSRKSRANFLFFQKIQHINSALFFTSKKPRIILVFITETHQLIKNQIKFKPNWTLKLFVTHSLLPKQSRSSWIELRKIILLILYYYLNKPKQTKSNRTEQKINYYWMSNPF